MRSRIVQGHVAKDINNSIVVVIDVLRAFTLTAILAEKCEQPVRLVRTKDEALEIKNSDSNACLLGEVNGRIIPGFDYGNSPSEVDKNPPIGKNLVFRTTNGVESVLNVMAAQHIFVASLMNAKATIEHLLTNYSKDDQEVVFLATDRRFSDEDLACAEYMQALITNANVNVGVTKERIRSSFNAQKFTDVGSGEFLAEDLELACTESQHGLVLKVHDINGEIFLKREK